MPLDLVKVRMDILFLYDVINQSSVQDFNNRFREDLRAFLNEMTKGDKKKYNIQDFEVIINPDLKLSNKTLMDFLLDSSLSKLLGLGDKKLTVKANDKKFAENYPKLKPFDTIEIHCNLVEPLIKNHVSDDETKILNSFSPNVDYKQKISEKPNEIHYLPIRKGIKRMKDIIISI